MPLEQSLETHLPYPLQHSCPAHAPPPFRAVLKPDRSRATKTGQITSQLDYSDLPLLTAFTGATLARNRRNLANVGYRPMALIRKETGIGWIGWTPQLFKASPW